MGKLFTITEGLENMGALKTGGQGSVYKGKRLGEIITAVKLLPTPIHSESVEDKNFTDFQNEVEKLKKVNEQPNPNVVKILSSGITETGNLPFIEMEFIEGPDLEDLLKPPHEPVFTLKETIKLAEQLANALAHCHKVGVRHGDIKSNNVKFNIHSGNYVLLDFGLAIMSDEQRRTSLRHAGAIEFMAPEQNEGVMLFQTDVYSFGIILFEVLAGIVPFPLKDKGETARNTVMVSHMETPVPDFVQLRRQNIPESWPAQKRERELNVPQWLLSMIYKCLEKKPEARFKDGIELHDYIVLNSTLTSNKNEYNSDRIQALENENTQLVKDKEQLQKFLSQYQEITGNMEEEIKALRTRVASQDAELAAGARNGEEVYGTAPSRKGVSKTSFIALLLLTICLGAFAAYSLIKSKNSNDSTDLKSPVNQNFDTGSSSQPMSELEETQNSTRRNETGEKTVSIINNGQENRNASEENTTNTDQNNKAPVTDTTREETKEEPQTPIKEEQVPDNKKIIGQYKLAVSKAYFHNSPDENTRRNAFIVHWNNAVLEALDEENGFIYVVFTNHLGQTSKGWLRKSDLTAVE